MIKSFICAIAGVVAAVKGCAAGAVLLASIGSAAVGCIVFAPKLLRLFTSHAA